MTTYNTYLYNKTAAPTVNDDSGDGYSIGDKWVDSTNDRIYEAVDVTVGAAIWLEVGAIHIGTSTPASPATNRLWFDTSNGIIWIYGTYASASRWVSATLYPGVLLATTAAARSADSVALASVYGTNLYNIWIDDLILKSHVITTNNGSNYWSYALRKITTSTVPAAGAGTLLGTVTTAAISANSWTEVSTSIDAVIDATGAGLEMIMLDITSPGTPGNTWDNVGISYRLVHP